MKTINFKSVIATGMVTIITTVGSIGLAYGHTPGFKENKMAINRDVSKIKADREKIAELRKQCRDEHTANVTSSSTHADLIKARAELKKDKAYAYADKKELMRGHRDILNEREKAVTAQRRHVRDLRRGLDARLDEGRASALPRAERVILAQQELDRRQRALERARDNRNDDLQAVNDKLKDANTQPTVTERRSENLAMK